MKKQNMEKPVGVRLEPDMIEEIKAIAAKEDRTFSGAIRWLLRRAIASYKDGELKN